MNTDRATSDPEMRLTFWAIIWYAGFLVGRLAGDFDIWPGYFALLLRLDGVRPAWIVEASIWLFGGIVVGLLARAAESQARVRSWLTAALLGLGCVFVMFILLHFVAWNIAEFFDWPTGP